MAANPENRRGVRAIPWRIVGWGGAACLLLLPLVAMQFTEEVNWTWTDFVFMGALLGSVGVAFELAVNQSGNVAYRAAAGVALAAAFLLVWLNLAVGIIGSEGNPANLVYFGVLPVALMGATIARFRPAGMAVTMAATALVQALVPVIAWGLGPDSTASVWSAQVLLLTGFFAAMWLLSARLFRTAARERASGRGASA